MCECGSKMMALKFLVVGIVLILVKMFTTWDIWIVIGVLAIIKAVMIFIMPKCKCDEKPVVRKRR